MHKHFIALVGSLVLVGAAEAGLVDRGGGMIYDTTLNITWLADWNYAKTQYIASSGVQGDIDGRMAWVAAEHWATTLNFGGYDDWRLPTSLNADGSGPCWGWSCASSEMGHMYYNDWGASPGGGLASVVNANSLALFSNVESSHYWSVTESTPQEPNIAWLFEFSFGMQGLGDKESAFYSAAVRPGDVSAVPEPQTLAMMLLGLSAMWCTIRQRMGEKF